MGKSLSPDDRSTSPASTGQLLSRGCFSERKRRRIAEAAAKVASERGVNGVTVAHVTGQARMARNTFYKLFANREEALAFALELGDERLRSTVERELDRDGDMAAGLEDAVGALIAQVLGAREIAELCLTQRFAIDRTASGTYDQALVQALADLLSNVRAEAGGRAPFPRIDELAALALLSVIAERVRQGTTEDLATIASELTQLAVALVVPQNGHP